MENSSINTLENGEHSTQNYGSFHPSLTSTRSSAWSDLSRALLRLWSVLSLFFIVLLLSYVYFAPLSSFHEDSSVIEVGDFITAKDNKLSFHVKYKGNLTVDGPITGRLMICLATEDFDGTEPRFLITDDSSSQQMFGMDIYNVNPKEIMTMNISNSFGYPKSTLQHIPNGKYWVQAVIRSYVYYNRSDNVSLWLPPFHTFEADHGVLDSDGTIYSTPQLVSIAATSGTHPQNISLVIDQIQPTRPPLKSLNKYLQHVEYRSPILSKFWGVDVYLKAWVLLPGGYEEHPTTKYPLFIYHSHYSRNFEFDFIENAEQLEIAGRDYEMSDLMHGYYFYRNWTGDGLFNHRRGIIVQIQHANPYYDDSYGVNSENIGPYGDAITYEFIPYIESKFRGIGKGWARTMYGGSTGGWESFAIQALYPDQYNGCWSFCPDALDFHHIQLVNMYSDENAYYSDGLWTQKERPARRNNLGEIQQTMPEENHHELALGTKGRSGGQWDAWQAVYSPRAREGYPQPIWDKVSGEIDPDIARHWIEHFDMKVYLEKNWKNIGPKLVNKLHIYVGMYDSYYLNDAIYLIDSFLQTTKPYYNGTIEYGASSGKGYEHCWTGDYNQTLLHAWNTLNFRMIPKFIDHIVASAPPNADLSFTKY